jgi:carnitine O-palmitoyltransferase 1
LPKPQKLKWYFDPEFERILIKANEEASSLRNDVDQHIYLHRNFGKEEFKRFKVSPDAAIQMALQLAYFNETDHFDLTYESSMTRLFRHGRTETIRSCSIESCEWVKSMRDENVTVIYEINFRFKHQIYKLF